MALVGYARVSTHEQETSLQQDALEAAGCERIFADRASGALAERPELTRALEYARQGDTLVVWRLVFHVIAALAEFERDLIREPTQAGLSAARARGRRGGRPPAMSGEQVAVARTMYDSHEHTTAKIAEVLGVSRATLYRHLASTAATKGEPD